MSLVPATRNCNRARNFVVRYVFLPEQKICDEYDVHGDAYDDVADCEFDELTMEARHCRDCSVENRVPTRDENFWLGCAKRSPVSRLRVCIPRRYERIFASGCAVETDEVAVGVLRPRDALLRRHLGGHIALPHSNW